MQFEDHRAVILQHDTGGQAGDAPADNGDADVFAGFGRVLAAARRRVVKGVTGLIGEIVAGKPVGERQPLDDVALEIEGDMAKRAGPSHGHAETLAGLRTKAAEGEAAMGEDAHGQGAEPAADELPPGDAAAIRTGHESPSTL